MTAWVTEFGPTKSELDACVQCGLCLPHCPTFRLTGKETASPRGRIQAMNAVADGVLPMDSTFEDIIGFCLGCRACEPVCPGMVPYGRLLEGTRAEITAQRPSFSRRVRAFAQGPALRSRFLLTLATWLLVVVQVLRLTGVVPARFRQATSGLRPLRGRGPASLGHRGGSGERGRAALLSGCVQDQWFRSTNAAAVELLEMAGYRVEAPRGQTCCGALAAHDGMAPQAASMAAVNTKALGGYDLVVATAAGCSAHLREYGDWAPGGDTVGDRALDITVAVAREIERGTLPTIGADMGEIAIQDPCHLRHAQRVVSEPRAILRAAGYRPVEIDSLGLCCGAAGAYTVLQSEASRELGNQKVDQIRSTGMSRVASANPGCEMQIRAAAAGSIEVAHPIEWYLQAVRSRSSGGIVAAVEKPS
jgi:glycolate oxidase iron-sulfur subunit